MDQDGKRKRTVNAEGDILSGTLIFRPLEISRRVLSDYSGSRCMSRKKKFGISHSDERNLKSGAPLRCKPAAMLEDAEQWGSDKGVRGRFREPAERGNRRDGCSSFPMDERRGRERVASKELEG